MQNLRRMVARCFQDDRPTSAFGFQSLYLGLSPYRSPAICSLLAGTETAGGLYFPMGGMHALPSALTRLAQDRGVDIRYCVDVKALERSDGGISVVRLADGSRRTWCC